MKRFSVQFIENKVYASAFDNTGKFDEISNIELLYYKMMHYTALCSRNFQNAKLRLDFLKFDHFTATQNLREIKFWQIQTVQKCHFWQFQRL